MNDDRVRLDDEYRCVAQFSCRVELCDERAMVYYSLILSCIALRHVLVVYRQQNDRQGSLLSLMTRVHSRNLVVSAERETTTNKTRFLHVIIDGTRNYQQVSICVMPLNVSYENR
jgi:hypothetical protein